MEAPDICLVLGTRPEIIKLAPVIRECERREIEYTILHTGQHYSDELDTVFFDQLELPSPDYNLEVGSSTQGTQTGEMIVGIEEILLADGPDTVLVQGDTNSVLAGAIATSKLDIELAHVEAGLRSFDDEMPEEINRVLTDHAADYLFAPTDTSAQHLVNENLESKVYVTGNTVVDSVLQNIDIAHEKSAVLSDLDIEQGEFGLMTAHRAENVDDRERFERILQGVQRVASHFEMEVLYPIHPRAENRIAEFNLEIPERIRTVDPLDYLDFLRLEMESGLILTDSGGIQEEACILRTPCVTLRDSTERPETIDVGANQLVGTTPTAIFDGAVNMMTRDTDWRNPFGDGKASKRIVSVVLEDDIDRPMELRDGSGTETGSKLD